MPNATLEYLIGSPNRVQTLRALRNDGPLPIRRLEERVPVSRRTLKRTLNAMTSRGWVGSTADGFEVTALGGMVLSSYDRFRDAIRLTERFRPFLEQVPASSFDLAPESLCDATLTVPDGDPTAAIDRLIEVRSDATAIRECASFLMQETLEQFLDSTADVTLVLGEGVPSPSDYSREYRETFEALLDADHIAVHAAPGDVRVPMGVADGRAFIGGTTDDGMPHSLLESDDPAVVAWVDRRFDAYLAEAEPIG